MANQPESPAKIAAERAIGRAVLDSTGVPGALSVRRKEWKKARDESFGVIRSSLHAAGGFGAGEVLAWTFPAMFKAVNFAENPTEKLRVIPGFLLDAGNIALTAFLAKEVSDPLATGAIKTAINVVENGITDMVGAAGKELKQRRIKRQQAKQLRKLAR